MNLQEFWSWKCRRIFIRFVSNVSYVKFYLLKLSFKGLFIVLVLVLQTNLHNC
ncbi:hypothetical protein Hdeb2414_s0020g00555461 [Helianthus debilis subsp. tardiflorus]